MNDREPIHHVAAVQVGDQETIRNVEGILAVQHVAAGPVGGLMVVVTLRDHDCSTQGKRSWGTMGSAAGVVSCGTAAVVEPSA